MLYERLFEELYKQKIHYVVAGGMAVVLHGVPRLTMDLDLIIDFQSTNLKKFISILLKLGYRPKLPVDPFDFADPKKRQEWIKKKNMKVFNFYHPRDPRDVVDVFVKEPLPFDDLFQKKVVGNLGPIKIYLAAIPHLVKMKALAGRQQDLDDIDQLKRLETKKRIKNKNETKQKKRV